MNAKLFAVCCLAFGLRADRDSSGDIADDEEHYLLDGDVTLQKIQEHNFSAVEEGAEGVALGPARGGKLVIPPGYKVPNAVVMCSNAAKLGTDAMIVNPAAIAGALVKKSVGFWSKEIMLDLQQQTKCVQFKAFKLKDNIMQVYEQFIQPLLQYIEENTCENREKDIKEVKDECMYNICRIRKIVNRWDQFSQIALMTQEAVHYPPNSKQCKGVIYPALRAINNMAKATNQLFGVAVWVVDGEDTLTEVDEDGMEYYEFIEHGHYEVNMEQLEAFKEQLREGADWRIANWFDDKSALRDIMVACKAATGHDCKAEGVFDE